MRIRAGILVFVAVMILAAGVAPAIAQQATEHPLIRPFPGTVLDERRSEHKGFGEYDFRVGTPPRNYETLNVRGEYRRLHYYLYKEDGTPNRDVSQLEYFENFKAATLEKGGEVKWEDRHYGLVFTVPREDGGVTWCHVQTSVSAAYNLELSQQRSESVLNYLLLFGIDPSRLQAKGYGESMPVAPNDSAENKAKNRRVELVRLTR